MGEGFDPGPGGFGRDERPESPGEGDQRQASELVMWFRHKLGLPLDQSAVASILRSLRVWWSNIRRKPK